jgi:hypothetical protein
VTHFPLGPLAGEFYDKGRKLVTLRPFRFVDGDNIDVTVPALFTTDFNSVPSRAMWWFFAPWEHPEAALIHDFAYRHPPDGWSRENADYAHWRILMLTGCPRWKAEIIFQFLSKGSKGAWKRYRERERNA